LSSLTLINRGNLIEIPEYPSLSCFNAAPPAV
jgi:hypothetical protein